MGFPGPIVRYAPPFIIEISICTKKVRIRASRLPPRRARLVLTPRLVFTPASKDFENMIIKVNQTNKIM